ncbi:MAG: acetyl-CoA C-acyltransferase [Acidimicrobiales bacterium]
MRDVVIVEAGRSAIGKRGGSLAQVHPADTLGPVMMEVIRRAGLESGQVDQVVGGVINKVGAQAMNVTRTAWLSHGGAEHVASTTIDSQCGSSQQALNQAYSLIASGAEDVVLACGVENMSRIPIGADAYAGTKAGYGKPVSRSYFEHYEFTSQFEGAERIADKYGISRQDTDRLGLESQLRAARAIAEGRFEHQIIPLEVDVFNEGGERTGDRIVVSRDEIPRDTSLEKLAQLKPVARDNGVHTAGSSSQIADGASAVLVMSAERAEKLGVRPRARIIGTALVGCDPVLMLEGPIPATRKLLERAGLQMSDIDVVEINEAFASVVLAWAKELQPDMERVNPNGGAIALGHPLGGTGCFLATKAVHELERTGGRYGIVTMCCGGGLGTGTLIERL